ncbi:hypothetical protein [Arsenophonus apicola]|uniref:hypothetical protein n=1 Tax=Arsenophonus apicola TaxID=2879119 RepID=UPI00387A4BF9
MSSVSLQRHFCLGQLRNVANVQTVYMIYSGVITFTSNVSRQNGHLTFRSELKMVKILPISSSGYFHSFYQAYP